MGKRSHLTLGIAFLLVPIYLIGLEIFALAAPDRPSTQQHAYFLHDDTEAMHAMLEAIDSATTEVNLSRFLIDDDLIGNGLMAASRRAARRGVRVRIMVDARFNRIRPAVMAHLANEGVQIRLFHPITLRTPLSWLHRFMHDKILSIDGRWLLVGGRNGAVNYVGLHPARNMIDRDTFFDSPQVTQEANRYFNDLFSSPHVQPPNGPSLSEDALFLASHLLDSHDRIARLASTTRLAGARSWRSRPIPLEHAQFVHSALEGDVLSAENTPGRILGLIRGARRSILIESPYVNLTPEFEQALVAAVRRGVSVQIYTNSNQSNNQPLAQASYESDRSRLLLAGIRLRERQGSDTLHAKSIVVDNEWAFTGSFNFNGRSINLDTEVGVIVRDRRFASQLSDQIFEDHWYQSSVPSGQPNCSWTLRTIARNLLSPVL